MNMLYEIAREYKNELIAGASIAAVFLGGSWALNKIINEGYTEGEGFEQCSHVTGIFGHTDYTRYDGDSAKLAIYGVSLWKVFSWTDILDSDGDNECEKMTKSIGLFPKARGVVFSRSSYDRKTDYPSKRHKFDEADYALERESKRLIEKKQKHVNDRRANRRSI